MRISLFILLLISTTLICQENDIEEFEILDHSVNFPNAIGEWKYKHALGLSLIYLPKDWLESANSLPMAYYKGNFSLKKGFSLHTEVKTIWVANDLSIGTSYNLRLSNRIYAGVGYSFAYSLGQLYDLGYDNFLHVTAHRPFLKLGYHFEDFTFTLRGGLDYSNKIYFEAGGTNLTANVEFLNGYTLGFFLEQRMFRQRSFSMGFTNNFLKFHILGWPAFTYTKRMYYIPEFTALFNF